MSNGGAQFKDIVIPAYPSYKLRAWAAGGTVTPKTIWSDEAKTSAITQPLTADANGVVGFYGDGDYNFTIHDSGDTLRYTLENVKLTADTGTMWEGNFGTATPAAVANAKGQMFATIDGSNILRAVSVNQSTSWKEIYTANSNGDQTFDSVITKTMPVYNVQHDDWGATPGEASDQTSAIQAAIDAIEAAGGGVLYFPQGTYQVDGSLDINNTNIKIIGDGSNFTTLKQTANPAAPMIDYDTDDVKDKFHIEGISLVTTVVASNTGLDCFWPNTNSFLNLNNCTIKDVYIGPDAGSASSAYFTDGLILSDAKKADVIDFFVRGPDNDTTKGTGITLKAYTFQVDFRGLRCHYLNTAIIIDDYSEKLEWDSTSEFFTCGDVIAFSLAALASGYRFTGTSFLRIAEVCVSLYAGSVPFNVSFIGCVFEKLTTSTANWKAVVGDFSDLTITGCLFKDLGSTSGTDICIDLDTTGVATISGNTFRDFDNAGSKAVALTANSTNIFVSGNFERNIDTAMSSSSSSAVFENNWPDVAETITAAATITPSPNTRLIELTGTVTHVTTINGGWVGRIITIMHLSRAASTQQIQTGGNLKLGANRTIENNNNSTLRYDGTNWIELSYLTVA